MCVLILGCIPSGPSDFDMFAGCKFIMYLFLGDLNVMREITLEERVSNVGKFYVSSTVKTLEKMCLTLPICHSPSW